MNSLLKIAIPVFLLTLFSCKDEASSQTKPESPAEKTEKPAAPAPAEVNNDNPVLIGEEHLNIELLEEKMRQLKPLKAEQLTATWEITAARTQTNYADKNEEPFTMNMDVYEGYQYILHEDGTFDCIAIIDTDGRWELRENNTRLYLYNNLREDEEEHYLLLSEDKLELIYVDKDKHGDTYFYMVWKKIEE